MGLPLTARSGPLAGTRVVEFAGLGPAPFAALLLADLGADVVTVDRIPAGGPADGLGAMTTGALGRGRRSIAVDVKDAAGRELVLDLVAGADALVEGFRPGVMERLGLGPEPCLARRPPLVYGRMTGWGQTGPLAMAAGHDVNYIAAAGVLEHIGTAGGPPVIPLNVIGDFGGGGMLLALGVLAAMLEARGSGRGQVVDAAMVDGSALLMTMMFELSGRGLWNPARQSNMNDGGAHFYGVYETADGRHVSIAAMEPKFYAVLLDLIGLSVDELPEQWNTGAWPALRERLAAVFRTRTRQEWTDLLEGTDACFAPVLSMAEAPAHPHAVARDAFVTVDGVVQPAPAPRFSRTPAAVDRGAAHAGEHTTELLTELGLPPERIEELMAGRTVAGPGTPARMDQ
ncbi:CaiB/BaiF CoA transferase family protein [Klenkia soli]|uniref:CaiB/BaiF CoA transferase family protein n=1 Tax=Klenkia soli TaxID=1052260 RepID=UPI001F614299|nr:CaiB/BaiF CoA-transferase family protein [Klenkia soli]